MDTPRFLYICRHGQRIDALQPRWYEPNGNRHDPYLSEQGVRQAQALGVRLRQERIDHIFSSPFLRALQTAHSIAEMLERTYSVDAGLGEWHNRSMMSSPPRLPTLRERQPDFPLLHLEHRSEWWPNYPESADEVRKRYQHTAQSLLSRYEGHLLLVGHGKLVTSLSSALTGLPEARFQYGLACLTKLAYQDGAWHVRLNGDTSHLHQNPQIV